MLAVVFTQKDEFQLKEVKQPKPTSGQVLVKVRSTTICGTDVKILHGTVPMVVFPHIPGHEFGGEVAAVGAGVSGLAVGTKVGVEAHTGCGECPRCIEGVYNLCENYGNRQKGHAHIGFTVPGGLAEYCVVPARSVHPLPDGLDYDHGAFTDTVGIVLWAFERAGGVRGGENVVVVGPGALGLLAVQMARALGAGRVIAVGAPVDHNRLELACWMGADDTVIAGQDTAPAQIVRDLTAGRGADLVIEFAGTAEAGRHSLEMARRGGRVVLGGATSPGQTLQVDLSVIVRKHLDVFGSMANPRGISQRANALMQKGLVDVMPLITHHLPLSEFPRAWEIFTGREEGVIRVMLHP